MSALGAPIEMLVSRLETAAQRFDHACAAVSPDQWSTPVTWTTGHRNAASEVVTLRLFEVEIHHVDLAAGRTIDDWPDELTSNLFNIVVDAFTSRADVPALSILVNGQDARHNLGHDSSPVVVRGARTDVLAWLLGRSDGRDLRVDGSYRSHRYPTSISGRGRHHRRVSSSEGSEACGFFKHGCRTRRNRWTEGLLVAERWNRRVWRSVPAWPHRHVPRTFMPGRRMLV